MHIMHVIDGLVLGGAQRMLVDLANATMAEAHRVSVCVTRSCVDMAASLKPGIQVHTLNRQRTFEVRPLRRFSQIVKRDRVDLIQAHSRSTFSMLALLQALGCTRTPVLMHDHYGSIETNTSVPLWFRFAGRFLLDHYVGVYEKLGAWAEHAGVPRNKINVIGNALDLSRIERAQPVDLRRTFGIQEAQAIGVVVAGICPAKGIDVLLQALALRPFSRPVKVFVVGDAADRAYAENCRSQAISLGLEKVVSFVGGRPDVPAILKGADFALMPSRSESGPLVLIEYMMAGLPFVSTLVGDVARLAEREGLLEFVAPDDPVAFREAMDRLLVLPAADWRARAEVGRALALKQYDIKRVMLRWDKVYAKVLAPKAE